jgi:hypothetical protein
MYEDSGGHYFISGFILHTSARLGIHSTVIARVADWVGLAIG